MNSFDNLYQIMIGDDSDVLKKSEYNIALQEWISKGGSENAFNEWYQKAIDKAEAEYPANMMRPNPYAIIIAESDVQPSKKKRRHWKTVVDEYELLDGKKYVSSKEWKERGTKEGFGYGVLFTMRDRETRKKLKK